MLVVGVTVVMIGRHIRHARPPGERGTEIKVFQMQIPDPFHRVGDLRFF